MSARNELDKFKDELILPVRQSYQKSIEVERRRSYQKGLAEGAKVKEEELTKKLRSKISKLPFFIRWLIGKRLD